MSQWTPSQGTFPKFMPRSAGRLTPFCVKVHFHWCSRGANSDQPRSHFPFPSTRQDIGSDRSDLLEALSGLSWKGQCPQDKTADVGLFELM